MKKKRFFILYILLLLVITIPLTIYGVMRFNKTTNLAASKTIEDTSSEKTSTSQDEDKNSEKEIEKPKVIDRFEGKNLIIPKGIPVLCYHAMGDDKTNTLYVSEEKFKEQMDYLKNNGYFTLNIKEFQDYILNNKPVPEKSVLITFDDGYANNYDIAYPILKGNSQNAFIALITDFFENSFYLSKEQVLEMHKEGIEFVSHTTKHQALDEYSYEDQLKILKDSKAALEDLLGEPVTTFVYPYSRYNKDTEKAVKEAGYIMSFDLEGGIASRHDNPIHIKRQYVNGNYNLEQFKKLLIVK